MSSVGPPTLTHLIAASRAESIAQHSTSEAAASAQSQTRQWFEAEPLWFKRAVFYEIHIRGFFDANGDGSGDFRGLTEKLDYLQWLGIDCIWLLPFYRSPLRDGGYDIARFHRRPPGLRDGRRRPRPDQRGARAADPRDRRPRDEPHLDRSSVVSGIALESRTRPSATGTCGRRRISATRTRGSSSSTPSPRTGPGIRSPRRYYWHRFFSHQPDLNYDNPEVQDAMLDVLRFWLDLGLDGFRLDAVPYLYRARGDELREPVRDPRVPEAGAA